MSRRTSSVFGLRRLSGGAGRAARWGLTGAIIAGSFVASAKPIGEAQTHLVGHLAGLLASRFPRAELPADHEVQGIVVLGGGIARTREGITLARRHPGARLLLSGIGEASRELVLAQTDLAGRVVIDDRATNTYENGVFSRELIQASTGGRWLLVTSAIHMPRAAAVFEHLSIQVLHWPVQDQTQLGTRLAQAVAHELAGLLGYWAAGRIRTPFPSAAATDSRDEA